MSNGFRLGELVSSKKFQGTLMFFAGLGMVIRESIVQGGERPSLYVLFGGMMGLPLFWGKGNSNGGNGTSGDTSK